MENNNFILSVTQLNNYLNSVFCSDTLLRKVSVHGEVVNLSRKYNNFFFSLKDSSSAIDCIMNENEIFCDTTDLKEGSDIIACGNIGIYSASGKLRMSVKSYELFGDGIYFRNLEKLKKKLSDEGLFNEEHKKKLPDFPEKIAIITSQSGAAVKDIVNVASRRNPHIKLCLYSTKVQGPTASNEMIHALEYIETMNDIDVIIIGRGGGSFLDLDPFNNEDLIRAIYRCRIPVVSAVGHQTDFTLCDFVSDLRAPTPSAAAEITVPDISEILCLLDSYKEYLKNALISKINSASNELNILLGSISDIYIENKFINYQHDISLCRKDMYDIIKNKEKYYSSELVKYLSLLDASNPLNILKAGYALIEKEGRKISSSETIRKNDHISIKMSDGTIDALVTGMKGSNEQKDN